MPKALGYLAHASSRPGALERRGFALQALAAIRGRPSSLLSIPKMQLGGTPPYTTPEMQLRWVSKSSSSIPAYSYLQRSNSGLMSRMRTMLSKLGNYLRATDQKQF
jgi:hypothetical protein